MQRERGDRREQGCDVEDVERVARTLSGPGRAAGRPTRLGGQLWMGGAWGLESLRDRRHETSTRESCSHAPWAGGRSWRSDALSKSARGAGPVSACGCECEVVATLLRRAASRGQHARVAVVAPARPGGSWAVGALRRSRKAWRCMHMVGVYSARRQPA